MAQSYRSLCRSWVVAYEDTHALVPIGSLTALMRGAHKVPLNFLLCAEARRAQLGCPCKFCGGTGRELGLIPCAVKDLGQSGDGCPRRRRPTSDNRTATDLTQYHRDWTATSSSRSCEREPGAEGDTQRRPRDELKEAQDYRRSDRALPRPSPEIRMRMPTASQLASMNDPP